MSNKKFDLGNYIKKDEVEEKIYKPMQYVAMPECLQKAIGLPGIPFGFTTMCYGLSDCGKTELMLKTAKEAVSQGNLAILILTENKMERSRLLSNGLIPGENCIVEENLVTLEDVYDYISMKVEDVKNGKLSINCMIFWDSVAATPSKESFEIDKDGRITKKYGPQKNASVIGYYNPLINKRIAETREESCPYTVGLFMVTQAYVKPPEFPGAHSSIVCNGGEKIWYPLALTLELKEGKRIKVGEVEVGLVAKIRVKKNHITGENYSGEILLAGNAMFYADDKTIKIFKDNYKSKDL
jgi:hypothetical protein